MAATVQEIYDTCTYDLFEDGGFVLGIVTDQQFYDTLNLVILDFLKQTGIIQRVHTQTVFAGQGVYEVPDDIMEISSVWLAGRWLPPSTQRELNNNVRSWRTVLDYPKYYYMDGLGIKSIGIAPSPNYAGEFILGPSEPNPPHSVYDSFSALCQVGANQVTLNAMQHRGLTVIGSRKPATQVSTLADSIPLIPGDLALSALPFGVLERLFSGDNELKDSQRTIFCAAQYMEVVNACKAITGESLNAQDS